MPNVAPSPALLSSCTQHVPAVADLRGMATQMTVLTQVHLARLQHTLALLPGLDVASPSAGAARRHWNIESDAGRPNRRPAMTLALLDIIGAMYDVALEPQEFAPTAGQ